MARVVGLNDIGAVAIIDDAPGGGDLLDSAALRNRPITDPGNWLNNIYFHSDFDYYELQKPTQTVSINHPAIAGKTINKTRSAGGVTKVIYSVNGDIVETDHTLYTHSLGYVPKFFVAFLGSILTNGRLVQSFSDGRARYVSAYATTTIVGLKEWGYSGEVGNDLPAAIGIYEVMVFKEPVADPSKTLMSTDGVSVQFGRGKVSSGKKYLRRVLPAESSFDLNLGRTGDVSNGRLRIVTGGNSLTDYGYDGAFTGSSYVAVGGTY